MLHPNQFQVNEAWIIFWLNEEPILTDRDGDFNFLALMDAASCYLMEAESVPSGDKEPDERTSRQLLAKAKSHENRLPATLFVPVELPARFLAAEAKLMGIEVVRVEEYQLQVFIGEARQLFTERMASPSRGTRRRYPGGRRGQW